MEIWRRWPGFYVAFAITLFVYLLSRRVDYAAITAVLFSFLAWVFRARGKKAEPIMLAIAAVTLSTMHQSSLGSLFLMSCRGDRDATNWAAPGAAKPGRQSEGRQDHAVGIPQLGR